MLGLPFSLMLLAFHWSEIHSFVVQPPPRPSHCPKRRRTPPRTTLTTTSCAQWCPSINDFAKEYYDNDSLLQQNSNRIVDSIATTAASLIFDAINLVQPSSVPALAFFQRAKDDVKMPSSYLSNDDLRQVLLRDCKERNSLVTADFTPWIFKRNCRFKDGSGLDGSYPIQPWILGCKLLFNQQKSKTSIDKEESLQVTTSQVTFRFKSSLKFRGPFSPRVNLTGQIMMTRDYETGLISSYQEIWDKDLLNVLKDAKLSI